MKTICLILGISVILPLLFQQCTPYYSARSSKKAKTQFLATQSLFPDNENGGGGEDGTNPNPLPTPSPTPPVPVTPGVDQPVNLLCSSGNTSLAGGNLKTEGSVFVTVVNSARTIVCQFSEETIRSRMINEKRFAIADLRARCPNLVTGEHTVKLSVRHSAGETCNLMAVTSRDELIGTGGNTFDGAHPFLCGVSPTIYDYNISVTRMEDGRLDVRSAGRLTTNPAMGVWVLFAGYDSQTTADSSCDLSHSPLLVQIRRAIQPPPILLTPPLDGVLFDILGRNSFPEPHAKKRISWFTPESVVDNYFVVLPNEFGQVNGIDEMFGDNTFGPKGFAENGYAALAQWDDNKDGFITDGDTVFHRLRFWSDTNGDGMAEAVEMKTAAELEIESLDLAFDETFVESDKYGNQIKMKSVVTTADGRLHPMYDIWFRVIKF